MKPLNYKLCSLYGIQSKKKLYELLGIDNPSDFIMGNIPQQVKPKIDYKKNPKGRLVEAPSYNLKKVQKLILNKLQRLDYPKYVFCGIKGTTVVDNASLHSGKKFVYQTDLSKFFPRVTRNKVYNFFIRKMKFSPDTANIIADICTINYKYVDKISCQDVFNYLNNAGIKPNAHIMTGSPVSCMLSYLVNEDMFNALNAKCIKQGISMSIYVDDITFSSFRKINSSFVNDTNKTLKRFGYKISLNKCKYSGPNDAKKITGVIIDKKGEIKVPNSFKQKMHTSLEKYKLNEDVDLQQLCGYLCFASLVEPKYKSVRQFINNKNKTI